MGIKAGLFINCKLTLNIAYRIFAGLAIWKREVTDEEKTITCGKLDSGKVEYGILKEVGLPEDVKQESSQDEIIVNGKKYILKV